MERGHSLEHQLYSIIGHLAISEPFAKSDEELHAAGLRHISVFGPEIDLPENFGARLRSMMGKYSAVGLRPSES